jgi:hypothetical protein
LILKAIRGSDENVKAGIIIFSRSIKLVKQNIVYRLLMNSIFSLL